MHSRGSMFVYLQCENFIDILNGTGSIAGNGLV